MIPTLFGRLASSLAVVFSLLAAACSGGSTTYVIGVSQPLSGDFANAGKAMVMALQSRVVEVNRLEKAGVRLELAILDDGNDPERALQNAEQLVKKENDCSLVTNLDDSRIRGSRDNKLLLGLLRRCCGLRPL